MTVTAVSTKHNSDKIQYSWMIFQKLLDQNPQKDRNGKRPQWKKSMGIKTTVYSKTAWTILVIRPHQKGRPLVGMATKQVMPHHFC